MNTEEQYLKDQYDYERGRAILYLDDFLQTAEIDDFVGIVNETMQKHYTENCDKKYFNIYTQQRVDLTVNKCSPTARRIAQSLVAEDAEDFAKYVAEVLRNEYGRHNYLSLITKLKNELDNQTNR